jgi:hypothetical protein
MRIGQRRCANRNRRRVEAAGGKFQHCLNLLRRYMKLLDDFSMLEPASRFSKTVATGMRVPRNTHAPLRLSATLSTAGH